jgi:hypothetical protein
MKYWNRKIDNGLVFIILIFVIAVISVITFYVSSSNKQEQVAIKLEVIKGLINGVLITSLGLFVKWLFDENARNRERSLEEEVQKWSRRKELFENLKRMCRGALNSCDVASNNNFSQLLSILGSGMGDTFKGKYYNDMMDEWQKIEPLGEVDGARSAYEALNEKYKTMGCTNEFKNLASSKLKHWEKYYTERDAGHDAPGIPADWQAE